jgi:sugar phosphate isomerase/epimerase
MTDFGISTSAIRSDLSKLSTLTEHGFRQLEIGFFDAQSLSLVMEFARREGLIYGFHDPLPRLPSFDYPFLTDPDEEKRATTLDSLRRTLGTAAKYNALYVVGHLPSVIWHPRPGLDEESIMALAQDSCSRLCPRSEEAGIPILLENVGPNPYFYRAESFLEIFQAHPALRFCLDIGHLHLTALHTGLDPLDFAEKLSPYTGLIHLYNATQETYRLYHHVPVHPSQRPEAGWADIPNILRSALSKAPSCTIVFEHTPQYPADEAFVAEGIEWAKKLALSMER